MSTEEKKAAQNAEALSSAEMSGVSGGVESSKGGRAGGGEFIVSKNGKELSDAEMSKTFGGISRGGREGGGDFLVDPSEKASKKPSIQVY